MGGKVTGNALIPSNEKAVLPITRAPLKTRLVSLLLKR